MRFLESAGPAGEAREAGRLKNFEQVAQGYLERIRRGEKPDVEAYAAEHPEMAADIRELFPTLALLEDCGPSQTGAGSPTEEGISLAEPMGEYRILREIARGGMGVVYEAEHLTLRRRVALKLLPPSLAANPSGLQRFLLEARAAGQLHHSNIVPVFEVGVHQGRHFYTMQYIHGQNLDAVISELRRLRDAEDAGNRSNSATAAETATDSGENLSRTVALELLTQGFHETSQHGPPHPPLGGGEAAAPGSNEPGARPAGEPRGAGDAAWMSPAARTPVAPAAPEDSPADEHGAGWSDPRDGSELSKVGAAHETYFQRVARVGLQVAEALDYAHRHGVLHRDIKPSNLILDTSGTVWVTDFGLAKHEGDDFTQSGDIVGTLRYMPPERLRGHADPRSDLYSLGLTLYELATLRSVVQGSDRARLLRQIEAGSPPAPRQLVPRMPRDLETIILKLIEKAPADRYASACDLADDLRRFLADHPIRARRSTWTERVWRWCRRNPVPATLASCVALLLVLLFAASLAFGLHSRSQARLLSQQTAQAIRAQGDAEQARNEATQRLFDACLGQAQAGRWSARVGQHFATMDSLRQAAAILPSLDLTAAEQRRRRLILRNEAIAAMPLVDLRAVRQWPEPEGSTAAIALPPDYSVYARGDREGNLVVRRVDDDQLLMRLEGPGQRAWFLEFSPDGRFLAGKFHRGDPEPTPPGVFVWDLTTRQLVIEQRQGITLGRIAFRGDSGAVALGLDSHEVRVYGLPSGQPLADRAVRNDPTDLCFSPAGQQLAISFPGVGPVEIWDCDTGETRSVQVAPDVNALAWSPDGGTLAMGAYTGEIYLLDVRNGTRPTRKFEGHRNQVRQLRFNHRGDLLLSRAWDATVRIWQVANGLQAWRHDATALAGTGFRQDDRQLALLSDVHAFGLWEITSGGPLRILSTGGESRRRMGVDFHPARSDLLVSATLDGVEVWDAAGGRRLQRLPAERAFAACFTLDESAVLASSRAGLQRWPLQVGREPLDQLQLGSPQTVWSRPAERFGLAASGGLVSIEVGRRRARLIDLARPVEPSRAFPHRNVDYAVISPDGRWVATTTWHGRGVRVWDTEQPEGEEAVRDLAPEVLSAAAAFSPDGRWLAVSDGFAYYLWEVGRWRQVYRIAREHADGWPGPLAFSPDSRILAVAHSRYVAQLMDPRTGAVLGVLETPQADSLQAFGFSRDGRYLAVAESENLQLWDLAAVRGRLRAMQLDWELDTPGRESD